MNGPDDSLAGGAGEKTKELDKIRQEVAKCFDCSLSKTRQNTVPGEGSPEAEVMFIGEAPGANEDKNGVPFCGAAGKFLDEMLTTIGLDRGDVFIANTIKCRPPENRDPEDCEKDACRKYLDRQFSIISPKLVVLLGRHATSTFLPGTGGITALHGRALKRTNGQVYLPLYHPAAALHNGGLRKTLIDDFKKIPAILEKIKAGEDKASEDKQEIKQQKLI